ncbi:alpha/beta-hydrolase [Cadophora sp. DSE1049]|nr:alpha/beta-hydrolase [Cadophora sp. DSE1049]
MDSNAYVVAPSGAPSGERHTHTIILLHGRDSIASEFAEELFESQASDGRTLREIFPTVKWVFPTSKLRRSARFNVEMSQWFDIWSVENPDERFNIQIEGMRESVGEILSIVREEAAMVPVERIFLGGISQSAATAIHALLYGGVKLEGFIGMCSWLPFKLRTETPNPPRDLTNLSSVSVLQTPVFLSHSKDDDVVPVSNGRGLSKTLREDLGFKVKWNEYEEGGHWVNEPQGVDDWATFPEERIAARP